MTVLVLITLLALSGLALIAQPAAAQEQQENATLPISYPATVLEGDSETCASIEEREMVGTQIREDIREILRDVVIPSLDIVIPCGGPGWALAASLDMTDPTQNCPSAWDERTENGKRVCFRQTSGSAGCDSVTFSTDGKEYTHVCGRAIGYQHTYTDAFGFRATPGTIDSYYVDGLSVTHGQPGDRTHIWTFAAGTNEAGTGDWHCPCLSPDYNFALIPSYVATNYFCESGVLYPYGTSVAFYSGDPLWDGDGCGAPNNTCCSFNSPPWFTVELPTPTTDDIEVRNCADQGTANENVGIELIEFYIR